MSWKKISELKDVVNYPLIDIEIFKTKNIKKINDSIDFAIIFNSCESRAMEYVSLFDDNQIKKTLLINFISDNENKKQNLKKNIEYLNHYTQQELLTLYDINVFNFHQNIHTIINQIPDDSIYLGAKWFIDITGVPSVYSIALVKLIKSLFPSPELIILNVSGIYSADVNTMNYFSEGFQEDTWIPFCEGNPDYSKPWEYFFLLGFEGERSLRIYKANEPASCKLVLANPCYSDGYFEQAIAHNNCLIHELGLSSEDIKQVDVGDIIEIIKIINERYLEVKDTMNLCIAPLGPKPHAIAASIVSLLQENISVMYQVPNRYILKEAKKGEFAWLYRLK